MECDAISDVDGLVEVPRKLCKCSSNTNLFDKITTNVDINPDTNLNVGCVSESLHKQTTPSKDYSDDHSNNLIAPCSSPSAGEEFKCCNQNTFTFLEHHISVSKKNRFFNFINFHCHHRAASDSITNYH